jgi:hypothetical protein
MKKILIIIPVIFLASCADTTMITGSWKSPSVKSNYNNILVAALTSHAVAKKAVEDDLTEALSQYNVHASKSIDLFPPEVSNSDSDRVTLMNKIHGKNIDAILTVSVLKRETETRYVGHRYPYDPFRYDYYWNFWGYYSYGYPYWYRNDYYTEKIYYIETNLYDSKTEKLIWSAQSKTYDLLNTPAFSKEFAKNIVNKLKEDGLLQPEPQKAKL